MGQSHLATFMHGGHKVFSRLPKCMQGAYKVFQIFSRCLQGAMQKILIILAIHKIPTVASHGACKAFAMTPQGHLRSINLVLEMSRYFFVLRPREQRENVEKIISFRQKCDPQHPSYQSHPSCEHSLDQVFIFINIKSVFAFIQYVFHHWQQLEVRHVKTKRLQTIAFISKVWTPLQQTKAARGVINALISWQLKGIVNTDHLVS